MSDIDIPSPPPNKKFVKDESESEDDQPSPPPKKKVVKGESEGESESEGENEGENEDESEVEKDEDESEVEKDEDEDESEQSSPPPKKKVEKDESKDESEDDQPSPPPKKKVEKDESEGESEDDQPSPPPKKKVKEERQKSTKSKKNKNKDGMASIIKNYKNIPSLEILKKWASDHNVSYKNLTVEQLYNKLKLLHLDHPKDKAKFEKKKADKTFLLRDQWKEQQEKLEKKKKLTPKEENRLAFLKDIFQNIKNREENKQKIELRNQFQNEEIKRFDFMYNMSINFNNIDEKIDKFKEKEESEDKEENYFGRDRFIQILDRYRLNLREIVKKYASYHDALSHYSMLLLLKMANVDEEEIQNEIHEFNKLEDSFMTSDDKERLEEMKNKVDTVQDISFIEKIKCINELNKISNKIKNVLSDDDDATELKEEEKRLVKKLKEINQRIQLAKNMSDQEVIIKNTINKLKTKLKCSLEDKLKFDEIQKKINILFNNPFSECTLNESAKENIATKGSIEFELKVLNEISELLTQLELNDSVELYEKIKKLKSNFPKINKFITQDLKLLYDSVIDKQKQVINQSFEIYNRLYDNVQILQNDDPENLVTRNMIRTLQRQLQQLELYKTKPHPKIKFVRTDRADLYDRIQFLKKQLEQKYCEKIDNTIKELEGYKGKPYTNAEIIKNIERQLLESSYDTKSEVDKINKLIAKFEIIDLKLYQKYKKEFNEEHDRSFDHDEYAKLLKQLDENEGNEELRKKVQSVSEKINEEMKIHFNKLKQIENELKSNFNFENVKERLLNKKIKPVISFHLPQHNCVPEFFKKQWVNSYSGIFYVHFFDKEPLPEMIDSSSKKVVNGLDFYKGTHYLDVLLCSEQKKHVDDVVIVKTHEGVEYMMTIQYELKSGKLVLNDKMMFKKEQEWKKNKDIGMEERIDKFSRRPVSELYQDLSLVIVHKLSKFFEKENVIYLKNELLRIYANKTVEELLRKLGQFIVFLDENYLKNLAPLFNDRLKNGYISEKEILQFKLTDILHEVLENVYSIPKKDLQKEIKQIETDPLFDMFTSIEPEAIEYIKKHKQNNVEKIIKLFPETYNTIVEENKMRMNDYTINIISKAEKAVNHFMKKTIYDMLITNHILIKDTIEPFVSDIFITKNVLVKGKYVPMMFKEIYSSLSEKDCYASSEESLSTDIVYYIENGLVYCFSLISLLSEKTKVNEFTNNPFSDEFLSFLAKMSVPKIKEEKENIVLPSLLKVLYQDLRKMEKDAIEKSDEYFEMFIETKDSLTKALYK